MSRFRSSKVRHVKPTLGKADASFLDLQPVRSVGESLPIAASASYVSAVWSSGGGSAVGVIPLSSAGKRGAEAGLFTIRAHARPVTDLAWAPFADDVLATASESGLVKVWRMPTDADGSGGDVTDALGVLKGHKKKISRVSWHPAAADVVATTSYDKSVRVWDVERFEQVYAQEHAAVVTDAVWDTLGARLLTLAKDGTKRLFDPRAKEETSASTPSHAGSKAARGVWLSDDIFATAGFSKMRERQLFVWDAKKMDAPLKKMSIDASTGVMQLVYDADTSLLFVAGKGDGAIRTYEFAGASDNSILYELTHLVSDKQHSGIAMLPKRGVDVMRKGGPEVVRLYKLCRDSIVPVSYTVPRKIVKFHSDVLPHCVGPVPGMSAVEWCTGYDVAPARMSLDPADRAREEAAARKAAAAAAPAKQASPSTSSSSSASTGAKASSSSPSSSSSGSKPSTPPTIVPVVSAPSAVDSSPVARRPRSLSRSVVRSSKYRHVFGKACMTAKRVTGVKAARSTAEGNMIQANATFFAVPTAGPGGRLAVVPMSFTGRLPSDYQQLESGSPVMDFQFNPFDDHVLATGLDDAVIKLWKLPEEGLDFSSSTNVKDSTADLRGHTRKVSTVNWNPVAANVLASSCISCDVKVWDVEAESLNISLDGHEDQVLSLAWNWDGSQFATTCRDRKLRLFDPRGNACVAAVEAHEGSKSANTTFLGDTGRLFTVGFNKTSMRQFCVWDTRSMDEPLCRTDIDIGTGVITPHYVAANGVMFLAGKGDTSIRFYELVNEAPWAHPLNIHNTVDPQMDVAPLPRSVVDFKDAEICRMVKLAKGFVERIRFKVPRTRKEFYQDDLYPPHRSCAQSALRSSEWFEGSSATPEMEDFRDQVPNMRLFSEAPPPPSAVRLSRHGVPMDSPNVEEKSEKERSEAAQKALFDKIQRLHKEDESTNKDDDDDSWESQSWSD